MRDYVDALLCRSVCPLVFFSASERGDGGGLVDSYSDTHTHPPRISSQAQLDKNGDHIKMTFGHGADHKNVSSRPQSMWTDALLHPLCLPGTPSVCATAAAVQLIASRCGDCLHSPCPWCVVFVEACSARFPRGDPLLAAGSLEMSMSVAPTESSLDLA